MNIINELFIFNSLMSDEIYFVEGLTIQEGKSSMMSWNEKTKCFYIKFMKIREVKKYQ